MACCSMLSYSSPPATPGAAAAEEADGAAADAADAAAAAAFFLRPGRDAAAASSSQRCWNNFVCTLQAVDSTALARTLHLPLHSACCYRQNVYLQILVNPQARYRGMPVCVLRMLPSGAPAGQGRVRRQTRRISSIFFPLSRLLRRVCQLGMPSPRDSSRRQSASIADLPDSLLIHCLRQLGQPDR